jgi:hypothetical protein
LYVGVDLSEVEELRNKEVRQEGDWVSLLDSLGVGGGGGADQARLLISFFGLRQLVFLRLCLGLITERERDAIWASRKTDMGLVGPLVAVRSEQRSHESVQS